MAASTDFGSWRHLAMRFFGALSPAGPTPSDEKWALDQLLDGEQTLWRRMPGPDRRHAVGVARDTIYLLGPDNSSADVVAAALLHDVGKITSGFGTFGRVGVTLAAMGVGRARLVRWAAGSGRSRPSLRSRVGEYLVHDRLGARLLENVGSRPVTVAWAAQHHLPPEQWTVDARVGAVLKAADGD